MIFENLNGICRPRINSVCFFLNLLFESYSVIFVHKLSRLIFKILLLLKFTPKTLSSSGTAMALVVLESSEQFLKTEIQFKIARKIGTIAKRKHGLLD